MIKRITIQDNEEFLRQKSAEVDLQKDSYQEWIDTLKEYCQNSECYALAPVQIGIPKRIIFIRNTSSDMTKNNDHSYNEEIIYINPKILTMIGHTQFLEGCGSCMVSDDKYVTGVLDRPYKVEFEYYDLDGNKKNKIIEGFEATVFCHEYDHLNGILHMDRIQKSFVMTLEEMKKYREQHPYSIISENEPFEYK